MDKRTADSNSLKTHDDSHTRVLQPRARQLLGTSRHRGRQETLLHVARARVDDGDDLRLEVGREETVALVENEVTRPVCQL